MPASTNTVTSPVRTTKHPSARSTMPSAPMRSWCADQSALRKYCGGILAVPSETGMTSSSPTFTARASPDRLLGRLGAGAHGLDVGPRQRVGVPELVERLVGHVGEAVPVAEVIQPAGLRRAEPEALAPADRVGVPRGGLLQRELVVVGRIAERGVEAVAHAVQVPSEHVDDTEIAQRPGPLGVFEGAALDGDGD